MPGPVPGDKQILAHLTSGTAPEDRLGGGGFRAGSVSTPVHSTQLSLCSSNTVTICCERE